MTPEEYVTERNAILAKDDLNEFIEWAKSRGVTFSKPKVAEIARHKMITACISLPKDLRDKSHAWLLSHSYESWA